MAFEFVLNKFEKNEENVEECGINENSWKKYRKVPIGKTEKCEKRNNKFLTKNRKIIEKIKKFIENQTELLCLKFSGEFLVEKIRTS